LIPFNSGFIKRTVNQNHVKTKIAAKAIAETFSPADPDDKTAGDSCYAA
jgi:hypothetical protein